MPRTSQALAAPQIIVGPDLVQAFREYTEGRAKSQSKETRLLQFPRRKGFESVPMGQSRKQDALLPRIGSEEDEDLFTGLYQNLGLLTPPYAMTDLWSIYEQCDTLWACADSLVRNCERTHDFEFSSGNYEKESPEATAELRRLTDFFNRVNERESFQTLRAKIRRDLIVTGNAYVEVIRNRKGAIERLYYIPSTHVRVTKLDDDYTEVVDYLPRDGALIPVPGLKRFRRFARAMSRTDLITNLVWFKEFGDPRPMDAMTGEYSKKPKQLASEIWWLKRPLAGLAYGVPEWVSCMTDVKGRWLARWVNYDALDQGGIPPFVILMQGGRPTEGTRKYLADWMTAIRDPGTYNEPMILTMEPDLMVDLASGVSKASSKAEIVPLRDMRSEEYMFAQYLKHTEEAIRKVYRLPPIFIGATSDYSYASAYASLEVAETQVFQPIRAEFDELVNIQLIQNEFKVRQWRFKTRSAAIGDKEVFYKATGVFGRQGGPTLNQYIDLANEAFGTNWPHIDGPLANKVPLNFLNKMQADGRITVDENGVMQVVPVPVNVIPAIYSESFSLDEPTDETTPGTEETPSEQTPPEETAETAKSDDTATDEEQPSFDDEVLTLATILTRVGNAAVATYEPPVIDEQDYIL